jgi:crossover junction endodeoxyribonuclease RuvC
MTAHIGIDPGLDGALALVLADEAIAVWDMPTVEDGKSRSVNGYLLADILAEAAEMVGARPSVVIERVSAMPGQGVSSMFNFGRSVGIVEGVVTGAGLPLTRVTPVTWKRRAKLIGKPKDASRAKALELWPEMSGELARKKDCGRADALLIAYYGVS